MFGGFAQYDVTKRFVDGSSARTEHLNKTPLVLSAQSAEAAAEYVKFFAFRDAILTAS